MVEENPKEEIEIKKYWILTDIKLQIYFDSYFMDGCKKIQSQILIKVKSKYKKFSSLCNIFLTF